MKYYRRKRYSDKSSKKILFRIFFVIAAAAVIAVSAAVLGNHLKKTVEKANERLEGLETGFENVEAEPPIDHFPTEIPKEKITVFAAGVSPMDEERFSRLKELKEHFDTVSVPLTEGGNSIYTSLALLAFARVPSHSAVWEEGQADFARMREFCAAAKGEGLRISGLLAVPADGGLSPTVDQAADCALLSELAELGFDEVIIEGMDEITSDCVSYLSVLAKETSLSVGVVLPAEEYLDLSNEKMLRTLSASGVFLCADLNTERFSLEDVEGNTKRLCSELRNEIEAHGVRILMDSAELSYICEEYKALREFGIDNIQITAAVSYDTLTEGMTEDRKAEETTGTTQVNPYASTSETEARTAETEKAAAGDKDSDSGWF